MEEALRRAAGVLEEAQGCLEAILSAAPAGMEAALRARVQASADAMSALCAGMALQHLRGAAAENKRAAQENARARRELEKAKGVGQTAGSHRRTWAEIAGRRASGEGERSRESIPWAADRSFFLHPTEEATLKRTFELASFEDALHPIVAGVPGSDEEGQRPIRTLVRTGRGAVRVEVAPAVAAIFHGQAESGRPVCVPGFGNWRVERQRPGATPSLVAMGVPVGMADGEVVQRLVAGSAHLVPAELRGAFGELRASRLLSKRRTAARAGAAPLEAGNSGADGGCQAGAEAAIATRSVRVFLKSAVLKGFLQLGFMKLGGVVVRVREYTPPLAYCGICKRAGSHPTELHRPVGRAAGGVESHAHPQ